MRARVIVGVTKKGQVDPVCVLCVGSGIHAGRQAVTRSSFSRKKKIKHRHTRTGSQGDVHKISTLISCHKTKIQGASSSTVMAHDTCASSHHPCADAPAHACPTPRTGAGNRIARSHMRLPLNPFLTLTSAYVGE